MPAGAVGTPYVSPYLGFDVNAGSTAFASGDTFTVTVPGTAGQYTLAAAAASDGSQNPVGILVDSVDTTAGAQLSGIYLEGEFNANSLIFGSGLDPAAVANALRIFGIHIKIPMAGDPV